MLQKIEDFISKHLDEVMNLKNVYLVMITVSFIMLCIDVNNMIKRQDIAIEYIHDLENTLEAKGYDVADVCGTDAYAEWYGE